MKRVTGIGGVFFSSKDPTAISTWYKEKLGVPVGEHGYASFAWREADEPHRAGLTTWAASEIGNEHFGKPTQQWMINYRVENLDALLEELQRAGVEIVPHRENHEYGKFAWIVDPDGNRVELWEPPSEEAS
jgi:predicted enzyme related to lactoylglutathione lyase